MRRELLTRLIGAEFDAHDMPKVHSSFGFLDDAQAEALLDEVNHVLDSGRFDARFTAEIARRFEQSSRPARISLFIRLAIVGTIFYNVFLLLDAIIVPDALNLAIVLQLGIATPVAIAMMIAIKWCKFDVNLAGVATLLTMAICTIMIFIASRSEHIVLFCGYFPLFLLSTNVVQALPFKHASGLSAFFVISFSAAMLCHPLIDAVACTFFIVVLIATAHYSLCGNYRINAGMRRAYLFALRESLRAQLLTESNTRLTTMVDLDPLTGVANRRHLDRVLAQVWTGATPPTITILMVDIDRFKVLNDTFGHQAGDEVLRRVAHSLSQQLHEAVGENGLVARFGGEEFSVVLPGYETSRVRPIAERLRQAVEHLTFDDIASALRVTISLGCAAAEPHARITSADLIAAADAALYLAKASGRNCCAFAPQGLSSAELQPAPFQPALRVA